jgi:hypothetical protein
MREERIPTSALITHRFPGIEAPVRIPELIAHADHVLKAIAEF